MPLFTVHVGPGRLMVSKIIPGLQTCVFAKYRAFAKLMQITILRRNVIEFSGFPPFSEFDK